MTLFKTLNLEQLLCYFSKLVLQNSCENFVYKMFDQEVISLEYISKQKFCHRIDLDTPNFRLVLAFVRYSSVWGIFVQFCRDKSERIFIMEI